MKVFNLGCEAGHTFEGWFGSADDYTAQQERGLVRCPVCDSATVRKLPAAPHLNFGSAQKPAQGDPSAPGGPAGKGGKGGNDEGRDMPSAGAVAAQADLRLQVLQTLNKLIAESEDVGDRFAEVARKIHHGEDEQRNIRGVTTPEERAALADEGIDVLTLPWPGPAKETLQ